MSIIVHVHVCIQYCTCVCSIEIKKILQSVVQVCTLYMYVHVHARLCVRVVGVDVVNIFPLHFV